jgi:Domain of unknown function (DUF4160)
LPKISEFFGIAIYMYFEDHPPAHFHARYAEFEAVIQIDELSVLRGKLPPRVLGLVIEWATLHRAELAEVWRQAGAMEPLSKIDPLE